MAASFSSAPCATMLRTLVKPGAILHTLGLRGFHGTAVQCKNRAARIRVGKGDRPVTYEQGTAPPPHRTPQRVAVPAPHPYLLLNDLHLNSLISGNLKGEEGAADRTLEDVFIRRFMFGTFHNCLANEIVIKRRGNQLIVCALMLQKLLPQKFYFLTGYTESLLSHFYKCPVKLEIQTLQNNDWDLGPAPWPTVPGLLKLPSRGALTSLNSFWYWGAAVQGAWGAGGDSIMKNGCPGLLLSRKARDLFN
ncbi:28S ribosomal protein S24, mitochondrial [Merluccius polli]|uniref:28S ribosomal protein S24, mitochondrial n=1 Tax=Merluccius polli TaxID=89951 RepID=A0AA47N8F7_MERPO|nr:28S ribosomal protein S24, mitochondrial [Merluccius polli]